MIDACILAVFLSVHWNFVYLFILWWSCSTPQSWPTLKAKVRAYRSWKGSKFIEYKGHVCYCSTLSVMEMQCFTNTSWLMHGLELPNKLVYFITKHSGYFMNRNACNFTALIGMSQAIITPGSPPSTTTMGMLAHAYLPQQRAPRDQMMTLTDSCKMYGSVFISYCTSISTTCIAIPHFVLRKLTFDIIKQIDV